MINNRKMNNKGFSLVELVIVITIMAILVVVLVPAFIRFINLTRISNDISNADMINDAVTAMITEDATDLTTNYGADPYNNNGHEVSNQGQPWVIDDAPNATEPHILAVLGGQPILPSVDRQNNNFYVYADEDGHVTVLVSNQTPVASVNQQTGEVTFTKGTILSPFDEANVANTDWDKTIY